jgi:hypothetical protein
MHESTHISSRPIKSHEMCHTDCVFSHTHGLIFLSLSLLPHMLSSSNMGLKSLWLFFSHGTLSPIRHSPKLRAVAITFSLSLSLSLSRAWRRDFAPPFFLNGNSRGRLSGVWAWRLWYSFLLLQWPPPPECRLPSNDSPPIFVTRHCGSSFLHDVTPSSSMMARATNEVLEGGLRRRDRGRPEAPLWSEAQGDAGVDLACGGRRGCSMRQHEWI